MNVNHLARCLPAASMLLLAASLSAQSFVENTTQVPAGGPFNDSESASLDLGDVDGDGDLDVVIANIWPLGQNRIWINQGGLQGGTSGSFLDETFRLPSIQDNSQDVDLVDIDGDGDLDIHTSNATVNQTSSNQGNLFLVNQGGDQGGTPGYFVNESHLRWVNVGVNDGATTFSSVAPQKVITSGPFAGGFIDWTYGSVFGDLDADGDLDLVHSSYSQDLGGSIPTRIFLNDGAGHFEEFNPSGYQLSINNIKSGEPALWCEGTYQEGTLDTTGSEADMAVRAPDVELGDLDGDLDLDVVLGAPYESPRTFENRLQPGGALPAFRDTTGEAIQQVAFVSSYEQELGDMDEDGDLDLFGVDWGSGDAYLLNDGSGNFGSPQTLPNPNSLNLEAEWLDHDADGDLDAVVGAHYSQDRLWRNEGAPSHALADASSELPASPVSAVFGVDSGDLDGDGDYDVLTAEDAANRLLENVGNAPDTHAPRVQRLEQAPDRVPSAAPTAVRVHVFDNASWDIARYDRVELEYSVDGGPTFTSPMSFAGGQLFRGELPGTLVGAVTYRATATDEHGNLGVSQPRSYDAPHVTYCTAGTSASGCTPSLSASGAPSATAASGFFLSASDVEGNKPALLYYGTSGRQANPWGNGTSYQCVALPVKRSAPLHTGGTAGTCSGALDYDLNARWTAKPLQNPGEGALVQAQAWYRDPQSTSNQTTSLTDAVEFLVGL